MRADSNALLCSVGSRRRLKDYASLVPSTANLLYIVLHTVFQSHNPPGMQNLFNTGGRADSYGANVSMAALFMPTDKMPSSELAEAHERTMRLRLSLTCILGLAAVPFPSKGLLSVLHVSSSDPPWLCYNNALAKSTGICNHRGTPRFGQRKHGLKCFLLTLGPRRETPVLLEQHHEYISGQ